jgi:RNA polymerase sigma factor (TIGR02999 family)
MDRYTYAFSEGANKPGVDLREKPNSFSLSGKIRLSCATPRNRKLCFPSNPDPNLVVDAQAAVYGNEQGRGILLPLTPQSITELLRDSGKGDQVALDALFEAVYAELRSLAKNYLNSERPEHTLQATALVNEAYVRLFGQETISWQNRAHFFSVAAQVMRNILVDHARRHQAEKRGSGERKVSLDDAVSFFAERDINLILLDDALHKLQQLDAQQCRIVELRFFGGLMIEEIAEVLQISSTTVSRDWLKAKMWLHTQIVPEA